VRRALALTAAGAGAPAPTEERFLEHFLDRYGRHSAVTTCPFEGVEETIGLLARRGHRLGICSNKPHRATVELLQRLGWRGRFDAVLGGDAVPNRKPDPEHLRATLRAMDAAGRPAVMVGDTMPDAQVAQRAGVPFVLAAYGYARVPLEQIPADATIQRFEQLPGVLEELMARSR
jgi:phosphoglycolate phosphatase